MKEAVEETQQRLYDFVDRYYTHVSRAQITSENLLRAHLELNIFVKQSMGTLPLGFMSLYEKYLAANSEHLEALAQILVDWRYLVSDDV